MGLGGQDGLLGQGDLPWPSVVAARTYAKMDVGGLYSADDMSAAEVLVAELQSSETQLSADEAEGQCICRQGHERAPETGAHGRKPLLRNTRQ